MSASGRVQQHLSSPDGEGQQVAARRVRPLHLIAAVAALFALFAITASGASAAVPAHVLKETFGSAAQPSLSGPASLAVNQSNGDLYVIEQSAGSVSRWKPDGTPDNFSSTPASNQITGFSFGAANENQVAVDSSSGKIYVVSLSENAVKIFNPNGSSVGELTESGSGAFGEACGVAVDSTGHVYVADATGTISKFGNPPVDGTTEEEIPFTTEEPCLIAAGSGPSAGYVFAAGYGQGVFKVKTGSEEEITSAKALALSIDPGTGHLYASLGASNEVKEFNASGTPAQEVSSTPIAESLGVAVNSVTGDVYVAESSNANVEVFNPLTKALGLTVGGTGSGEVKCRDKAKGGSFDSCASTYPEAHTIELQATASSGSFFGGWSEFVGSGTVTTPCTGTVTVCEVNLAADVTGKATFTANPTANLKVTRSGNGSGSVSSVPAGINCGLVCESSFQIGNPITLEATAASGSAFVEWTGCDSVAGSVCHISLSGASTVGAVFNQVQHSLTINKAGSGGGSVSCDGGACAGSYPEGTTVTLTAAPESSSTFSGWSGGGCSGSGSCTVTVNANTAVTATFDLKKSAVLPPAPCVATVGSSATVTSGQAAVVLTCPAGTAAAKGKITLKAKVKQGKKQKTVVIGTASFNVAAGKSATVKVKITNGEVKKQLNNGKVVKAQVSGDSVKSSTVKLKPSKPTGKKGGHK